MKVSTEHLPDRQAILTIEIEPERVQKFLQQGARKVANRVRIPGFRKGKAPFPVILAAVGKEALLQEVMPDLLDESYREALAESGVEPIGQASLEDVQIEPMVVRLRVPLAPVVKPGSYRSIRVEPETITVTDEEVDQILHELRDARSPWVDVDRPAQYDDLLTVDVQGSTATETIIDQTDWQIIPARDPQAELWPGFDASFLGMQVGETREFDLTYPADADSRWAGQTAHFRVTLKKVQERRSPELDDAFAASVGDFASLDALRANIREGLQAEREMEARSRHLDQVLEALVNGAEEVVYPPALVEEEIDAMMRELERALQQRRMSMDDFLKLNRLTREQYREQVRPRAEQRLKRNLLLGAVATAENLDVTEEEINAQIERILSDSSPQTQASLRQLLSTPAGRQLIANDILTEKTLNRLLQIARGEAEASPQAEAEAGATATAAAEVTAAAAAAAEVAAAATAEAAAAAAEPVASAEPVEEPAVGEEAAADPEGAQ